MPRIIEYTENEGSAQTSASTVMNLINQSKSATSGMAAFQIKTIVVSSTSAVIFGQAAAMLFAGPFGQAPAFLLGAAFGYMGGLVHRWRTDVMEAKEAMIRYPALMEHHIRDAIPCELKRVPFHVFHARAQSDPYFQGYAIAALYSAAASIGRIRELREEAIIAVEAEKPDPDPDCPSYGGRGLNADETLGGAEGGGVAGYIGGKAHDIDEAYDRDN